MQSFQSRKINRRRFTVGSAAAFAAVPLLPGITMAAQDASPAAEFEDQLEIFSWWTNPGEADGLQQLFDHFASTNPNVEIVNATVAGGAEPAGADHDRALQPDPRADEDIRARSACWQGQPFRGQCPRAPG